MESLSAPLLLLPEVRLEDRERRPTPAMEREDTRLAARAQAGDRAAFGRLFERHAGLVHGLLLAQLPARDVPDLCQEAFACALASLRTLSDPARFGPWLAAIARNLAHDANRRRSQSRSLDDDLPEPQAGGGSPEDDAASAELIGIVRALPEAYRETLVLRLVEGLTGPEIALRTGLTHGSVRVNLHRGMRLLRERISESKP
jgi:RNA polymerase sigma-70 factor, ECF subfamily